MSWELSFQQGVHNGAPWETQAGAIEPNRYIQGDTRTFSFLGSYEISAYPVRRIGLGFRVGAGLVLTPLLMVRDHYETEVLGEWGVRPPVHETPHPVVFGGPTFEYYTKLSHFSIGVDVDASYAIGFDLGLTTTGYMKYTFGKSLGEKANK